MQHKAIHIGRSRKMTHELTLAKAKAKGGRRNM